MSQYSKRHTCPVDGNIGREIFPISFLVGDVSVTYVFCLACVARDWAERLPVLDKYNEFGADCLVGLIESPTGAKAG